MTQPPAEIDRLLLVSRQPDAGPAAAGLARALTNALAKVKHRDGFLIAQLDELRGDDLRLVADLPFTPPEPVALCLTGTPIFVSSLYSRLLSVTKTRYAPLRPLEAAASMRICAVAREGLVTVDTHREFGAVDLGKLTKGGWQVGVAGGEELCPALVVAEGLLQACKNLRPTKFAPPGDAAKAAPTKRKSLLAIKGLGRRKIGRR